MKSFLAPIYDYTDLAFRQLCRNHGAESACVPLVNSLAVLKGKKIDAHPEEKNLGVQLVGNDPDAIGRCCSLLYEESPFISWFNLNCGCPSSRTMGCGGGSAMLSDPGRIARTVSSMKRTDAEISVKIRIRNNVEDTLSLCRELERAGADFIIIHGRTPGQGYSEKADWHLIKAVHENVGIPVIGNGDIRSASEGLEYIKKGFCDGYMVGRAAMANPLLFENRKPEGLKGRYGLLREYLSLHRRYAGDPDLKDIRAKALNFISGVREASRIRNEICRAKTIKNIVKD